ncbi:flavodoxin-dependent (E)-4-hydroxy-3-methylbut-2-enyl-diphosphate synthase, partial [Streptomyces sp. NPDC003393]
GQIFVKGEVIKTVPESKIVETLIEEAMKIAEETERNKVAGAPTVMGTPTVTVS